MREFLGTIEGAADHAADWLDNIASALASEGAHNVRFQWQLPERGGEAPH